jgi:hypothetical protein
MGRIRACSASLPLDWRAAFLGETLQMHGRVIHRLEVTVLAEAFASMP